MFILRFYIFAYSNYSNEFSFQPAKIQQKNEPCKLFTKNFPFLCCITYFSAKSRSKGGHHRDFSKLSQCIFSFTAKIEQISNTCK